MQASEIQPVPARRNGYHSAMPNAQKIAGANTEDPAPSKTSENTTDPVVRQRYQNGSTRTRRFAYDEPLADGERLRDTPLVGLLEELSRSSKAGASFIEWFYDHVLQNERDQLLLLRAEEEAKRRAAADHAEAHNNELEVKKEHIWQASEAEQKAIQAQIESADDLLHTANLAAAISAALAGGVYDPEHPEAACLRHAPEPLGVVMGRSGLPWVEGDSQVHLPVWLTWGVTVLVGAMIGISLGMLCHALHPDSLDRTGGMTLAWIAAGFAVAVGFKCASRYAWYLVGQYAYLQFPQRRWMPAILTAILVTGLFVTADAMTNLQGLLAMASQDAGIDGLSGASTSGTSIPLAMYFVSLVISGGLIACSSYEGYLRGRRYAVHNRTLALQHDEFTARDSEVRSDPKTIAALILANEARVLAARKASLEARSANREDDCAKAIRHLDDRRLPACDELSEKAEFRIEDQRHNVLGAMRVWNHLVSCAFPRIFRRCWWR